MWTGPHSQREVPAPRLAAGIRSKLMAARPPSSAGRTGSETCFAMLGTLVAGGPSGRAQQDGAGSTGWRQEGAVSENHERSPGCLAHTRKGIAGSSLICRQPGKVFETAYPVAGRRLSREAASGRVSIRRPALPSAETTDHASEAEEVDEEESANTNPRETSGYAHKTTMPAPLSRPVTYDANRRPARQTELGRPAARRRTRFLEAQFRDRARLGPYLAGSTCGERERIPDPRCNPGCLPPGKASRLQATAAGTRDKPVRACF